LLTNSALHCQKASLREPASPGPCKTRRDGWTRFISISAFLMLSVSRVAIAQEREGDEAWSQARYDAARTAYQRVLAGDSNHVRANLRTGVILSWQGKLDSSLVYLARARKADPSNVEIRLIQARVLSWDKQYAAALARYDSLLVEHPGLHDAVIGRARTLAWAGRLEDSRALYRQILSSDSTDRDALLGAAQVGAWKGELTAAEQEYREVLAHNPRDVEARVGLGYVYFWQGRTGAAARQAAYALAIDSTAKSARELQAAVRTARAATFEPSATWSNDSDDNTSFSQAVAAASSIGERLRVFGSANALQASDPIREGSRVGAEAGITLTQGKLQLSGAGGARRLAPEVAPSRTAATYRGRVSFRPISQLGLSLGYSRLPFDETAALIERALDMESFEAGLDLRPTPGLTLFGGAGRLWLSDGNSRSNYSAGVTQKIQQRFFGGLFGRTLKYEQRGVGYFSPDRFWVLETVAGYNGEHRRWTAGFSGGLGAQQVGAQGVAQTEWHVEGRVGPRWGADAGNRLELFGLLTNSAVSSTTGAFRYGALGVNARLTL
jgi:tetratricopeptide (TPR) repeat protein